MPSVLEAMRNNPDELALEDIVYISSSGVLCVESGGPTPGVGCAGRGIIAAFEKLAELKAFETYKPDIVLYDVLGDVVCGGFAMPMRGGYAEKVFIVTSGEMMSLFAAENISRAVRQFSSKGYAQLGGLILNAKGFPGEGEIVEKAAAEIEAVIIARIPRDPVVQQCEEIGRSVVEGAPTSVQADYYRRLSRAIYG
jgi:nitrogenase iron protein NifH